MKHILFLVSSMHGGGAERVAALLCNQWVKQGHQVTLMPTFSGRGDCLYLLDERVKLDFLADRLDSTSRSISNKIRRMSTLRRAIREISPDVVVSFLPPVNVAALVATIGLKTSVIVSERIYPPSMPVGWGISLLRKLTYPTAHSVVMQTIKGMHWLTKTIPTVSGAVIPNPVIYPLSTGMPEIRPDSIVPSSKRVLLAVGRLEVQKGFDLLLQAFGKVSKIWPDWDLVILGEGTERGDLELMRHQLELDKRVYLPGRAGNLAEWYNRANLYVMSSRFEGFPNTLLEAMAYGLPAVSFDCDSGPRDIIRHETDGLLVAPDSGIDGLVTSLNNLMSDDQRRKMMGQCALEVRERFSMEKVASLWDKVLGLKDT